MIREIKKGSLVIYIDPYGKEHNALVTEDWGSKPWDDEKPIVNNSLAPDFNYPPVINLVYVTDDPNRKDQYGHQIIHESSVSHMKTQGPNLSHPGRCYRNA